MVSPEPTFDPAMAARVLATAHDLAQQGDQARNTTVRRDINVNVHALVKLGRVMRKAKSADRTTEAVRGVRLAYQPLKETCRINGAHPSKRASSRTGPVSKARSAQAAGSAAGHVDGACLSVQRVFDRMRQVSVAWSPEAHPFDPTTARSTDQLSRKLESVAQGKTPHGLHTDIVRNAATLHGIAVAMDSHQRSRVYDALGKAQLAYSAIQSDCSLT